MNDSRKEYINELLHAVRQLEEQINSADMHESLSFSFFNESFDRIQLINELLHKLQSMQIEDMKRQLEKLAAVLSGKIKQEEVDIPATETLKASNQPSRIELPSYRNPWTAEPVQNETPASEAVPSLPSNPAAPPLPRNEKSNTLALNDVIQAPPSVLDLKKGLSLNDRFLFQRELFHNNREEMNSMMIRLNAFENYGEAEEYIKEKTNWNFDEPVVKDFLAVIKKGYA